VGLTSFILLLAGSNLTVINMQELEKTPTKGKNLLPIVLGIGCLVLLVGLVITLAYYSTVLKDKDAQIRELMNQNTQLQLWLQENTTYYRTQIEELNTRITKLVNETEYLNKTVAELKAPQLHEVGFEWEKHEPAVGQHYMRVKGSVFNSGVYTAKNVQIYVWLYDDNNTLIASQLIYLGDIPGKTYVSFSMNIYYSGHCANYTYKIVYE